MARIILLAFCALLLAGPAWATLYVVDTSHPTTVTPNIEFDTTDVYNTTEFATFGNDIGLAASTAAAGDTIYVHSGTFTDDRINDTVWENNQVLVFNADDTQYTWTNTSASVGVCRSPTIATGVKVYDAVVTLPDDSIGWEFTNGSGNIDFYNCDFVGTGGILIYLAAGITADTVTWNNCTFTTSYQDALGTIWMRSNASDFTFTNCTFDLSGITTSGSFNAIQLTGSDGFLFDSCTFKGFVEGSTGNSTLVLSGGNASYTTDDLTFRNCSFDIPAPTGAGTVVTLLYGSPAVQMSTTLGVVEGCVFVGPNDVDVSGLKLENGALGGLYKQVSIIGNTFTGFHISIGLLEGARGAVASHNKIIGMNSGTDIGIYFQDARWSEASYNRISNCDIGIQFANGSAAYNNQENRAIANYFTNCDAAFNMSAAVTDSGSIRANNLFDGSVTNIGIGTYGTITTVAAWQAVASTTLPSYHVNGQGAQRVLPGNIDGALRSTGTMPAWSNPSGWNGN